MIIVDHVKHEKIHFLSFKIFSETQNALKNLAKQRNLRTIKYNS